MSFPDPVPSPEPALDEPANATGPGTDTIDPMARTEHPTARTQAGPQ